MKTQITKSGKVQTKIGTFSYKLKMKSDGYALENLILFIPKVKVCEVANQTDLKKDVLSALGFYAAQKNPSVVTFCHRF